MGASVFATASCRPHMFAELPKNSERPPILREIRPYEQKNLLLYIWPSTLTITTIDPAHCFFNSSSENVPRPMRRSLHRTWWRSNCWRAAQIGNKTRYGEIMSCASDRSNLFICFQASRSFPNRFACRIIHCFYCSEFLQQVFPIKFLIRF